MENDDLFEILDAPENDEKTTEGSDGGFVQDESFVNSLDFNNGFSDAIDEEVENILASIDEISLDENPKDDVLDMEDKTNNDIDLTNSDPTDNQNDVVPEENLEQNPEQDQDSDDTDYTDDFDDEDFEQTMVITEGTSISGSITTDCSLDVFGTIEGDIFCNGKLSISGKVKGNSHATEVLINAQRTEGNIECDGVVKIGQGSVVIGDISADAAVIAGAVKGTLDIKGPVILDSTAVIKGNIKAKTVQLINGAILEGFCSVEYSNPQVDEIFQ